VGGGHTDLQRHHLHRRRAEPQNLGIRNLYSLTYNSRTQGAIEKANRDLKTKIAQYQFQPTQADLQLFIDNHNATVSTTTGMSPKEAIETKGLTKVPKAITATSRLQVGNYVRARKIATRIRATSRSGRIRPTGSRGSSEPACNSPGTRSPVKTNRRSGGIIARISSALSHWIDRYSWISEY